MLEIGRMLILLGAVLMVTGGALLLAGRGTDFSRLPGDILIERENFRFYFPLTTCILISTFLTLIFWLFSKKR